MVQLPSAASDRGNSRPSFSARSCRLCRMQPASTVKLRLSRSTLRTAFRRVRLSTICVPVSSGVEPTDRPVLPPCGIRLTLCSAQALTTAATSLVLAGRTTASALPRVRLRQSCSQPVRSPSVSTYGAPTVWRSRSRKAVEGMGSNRPVGRPKVDREKDDWAKVYCAAAAARAAHERCSELAAAAVSAVSEWTEAGA